MTKQKIRNTLVSTLVFLGVAGFVIAGVAAAFVKEWDRATFYMVMALTIKITMEKANDEQ